MNYVGRAGYAALYFAAGFSVSSHAGALDESHLTLGLRNFYFDRDFRQSGAPKSHVGSWSQGFDLQYKSKYTEGTVKFGLDLFGQYALRLDGGGGRGPDGVLPYDASNRQPVDDYGRANAALRIKASNTEIRIGEHRPILPVAYYDESRQLVTTFEGATVESKEWANLTLNAGRFWKIATRESSNRENIYLLGRSPAQSSDGLNFSGGRYEFTPALSASYYFAQLEDIYRQHFASVVYTWNLGDGYALKTDVRYFKNGEDGARRAGAIDNQALGVLAALSKEGHTFTAAYQGMTGDDAFPLLNGYAPQAFLVNWSTLGFYKADERSWQARYDYNFASLGVPGLKFMTRYIRGTNIDRGPGLDRNVESEAGIVASYVIQSGTFKGLGFEARNTKVKTRYGADFDENRLITSYTWKLW